MNWNSLPVIGLGVILIIIAMRGSQMKIWQTITDIMGLSTSSDSSSSSSSTAQGKLGNPNVPVPVAGAKTTLGGITLPTAWTGV